MTHPANLDPLLLALVEKLPRPDEVFTSGDRERWLAAMDAALQLLYPPEWVPEARRKAKEAAAAHFPTIEAPEHGKVTIGVPTSEFEPVLVVPPGHRWVRSDPTDEALAECIEAMQRYGFKEAPSTTSADAVDDASGGEEAAGSGAGHAPDTSLVPPSNEAIAGSPSSTPTAPPPLGSAPTSPGSGDPAPANIPHPEPGKRRHFTADQKGAILRRVVREGINEVADDTLLHVSTLNRWMREMPRSVQTFTDEWEAEQKAAALSEGHPPIEELEAERKIPVPPRPEPAKPAVQWPTQPIERRPIVDHDKLRRLQADLS